MVCVAAKTREAVRQRRLAVAATRRHRSRCDVHISLDAMRVPLRGGRCWKPLRSELRRAGLWLHLTWQLAGKAGAPGDAGRVELGRLSS
eukprot:1877367-Rhodomonas_salina.1